MALLLSQEVVQLIPQNYMRIFVSQCGAFDKRANKAFENDTRQTY